MGVIPLLFEILTQIGTLLGIVQAIQAIQNTLATAAQVAQTNREVDQILGIVEDIQHKVTADDQIIRQMFGELDEMAGAIREIQAVLNGVTHVDSTSQSLVVNLPTTTGGSLDPSDLAAVASYVWNTGLGAADTRAGDYQIAAGERAGVGTLLGEEIRVSYPGAWLLSGDWTNSNHTLPSVNDVPSIDPHTILPTDASIQAWITRVYGSLALDFDADGQAVFAPTGGSFSWRYDLSPAQFEAIRRAAGGTPAIVNAPPVWPGEARVTLGAEVAMTNGLGLVGPMDGVIIRVAGAPTGKSRIAYGDHLAILHLGAITFETDAGSVERIEAFNWDSQVICPRAMVRAAKVWCHVNVGVSATIQPWSIAA